MGPNNTQVDTKDVVPKGTCCFCVPLKPGALSIAIIIGVLHIITALFALTSLASWGLKGILAIVSFLGAYCIYTDKYRGTIAFAWFNAVSLFLCYALTVVYLCLVDCVYFSASQLDRDQCIQIGWISIGILTAVYLILGYLAYVLFDYAYKLRRSVMAATNVMIEKTKVVA